MMDSKIGNRDKYFILANRRVLKNANHPIYRLSMQPHLGVFDFVQDVKATTGQTKDIIIKTTNNSYGVGKAMELTTNLIADRNKE